MTRASGALRRYGQSRTAPGLRLPEERLVRIEDALRERFAEVSRPPTRHCTVFDARM